MIYLTTIKLSIKIMRAATGAEISLMISYLGIKKRPGTSVLMNTFVKQEFQRTLINIPSRNNYYTVEIVDAIYDFTQHWLTKCANTS